MKEKRENDQIFENYRKTIIKEVSINNEVPFRLEFIVNHKKQVYNIHVNIPEAQLKDLVYDKLQSFIDVLEKKYTHDISGSPGYYAGYSIYEADINGMKEIIKAWEDKFKQLGIYVETRKDTSIRDEDEETYS